MYLIRVSFCSISSESLVFVMDGSWHTFIPALLPLLQFPAGENRRRSVLSGPRREAEVSASQYARELFHESTNNHDGDFQNEKNELVEEVKVSSIRGCRGRNWMALRWRRIICIPGYIWGIWAKRRLNISSICKNATRTILSPKKTSVSVDSKLASLNVGRKEVVCFELELVQYFKSKMVIVDERVGHRKDTTAYAGVVAWIASRIGKRTKDPITILNIRSKK
ncbi:hypothetical protein BT96DRAFT_977413 [Gymnopus androsaceus JB14]|uniref:Uncharacterized protein n=1 Tax=Gymnopus androsaceus JB14 TaxID=1447944 RepID=A0A6A4HFG5_9AGAR|nr:hypothetical protein BT96DRAFT_977413 [Gymnopus androsaceus JB14]